MTPLIGVLALQGDVAEHRRALEAAGARTMDVRRPAEVDQVDGLVIPGGESSTIDRLTRIFEVREPIMARMDSGMPVFGSCAGMIMVAAQVLAGHRDQQTLGGIDISVRRNAFGRQRDSFECDLDVASLAAQSRVTSPGAGGPFRAVFIRAPWVERVGPGVEVLATVEYAGGDHVVAVRQNNVLATSFHPEMTTDHRFHALFVSMVIQHTDTIGGVTGAEHEGRQA